MLTITSRKNERIVHIKKLGADAAYRRECGEFLCDGYKLLGEAVQYGAEIRSVLFCGDALQIGLPDGAELINVPRDVLESVSPQKTPQDILFTCRMPDQSADNAEMPCIILENVQDPGNVGTILRTAGAFGIKTVMLVGACADPYSPKTVRASMGAVFRQRVIRLDIAELQRFKRGGAVLYGAALSDEAVPLGTVELGNAAVAIGSEGQGLSRELMDMCDKLIVIPMESQCESLNAGVAASVIMWEMYRR